MIMALGLGMVSVANAQYTPKKGDVAVEVGFTPFESSGETFKLNEGMLKMRYFLSDKDAIRVKLNLGIDNSSSTTSKVVDPADKSYAYDIESTSTESNANHTDFSFALGYERHLQNTGRFDVYVGGELGYGLSNYSGEYLYDNVTTSYDAAGKLQSTATYNSETIYNNYDGGSNHSSHYFTASIFTGVDYYIYKGLYVGAELGINFKSGKSPNYYEEENSVYVSRNATGQETYRSVKTYSEETGVTIETTTSNGTTTTNETHAGTKDNETTTTKLKFYIEPAIRLGWTF